MQRLSFLNLSLILGAVFLLASCHTEQKQAVAAPPPKAMAPTIQAAAAPPASAVVPVPAVASPQKTDAVPELIAKAEQEYQTGRANYSADHLEAAKENFNRAFDLLLRGGIAIHSDERLEREFEKIAEGVYQLELLAVKKGDGFAEQRAVEAPIDESNEVTFPVDPSIMAKAEAELKNTQSDLPLTMNDAVASYINYFSNSRTGRGSLEHGYVRSGRYSELILKTLKEEGVPQDLIYLAQAESGFHPLALSRAGARGMWQFMAGRAGQYGLGRNWWVDERQDPVKSTRAAAHHLKDLYDQFGDWYLAMAAYNSGPGTVQRAVERTGYADYWELYRRGVLPAETRNYVPIILAITIISKNPGQYGLDRLRREASLPFETVKLDHPVDLRLAAECADTSVAMLQELNPSLLRLTTPKDQEFELRLPEHSKEKFEQAIAAVPSDMRVSWSFHRVEAGDTLASIARKYHTTAASIMKANQLDDEELKRDARLVVPITPGREGDAPSFAKAATHYKVRRGDTLVSVAEDFNVPVESLRRWNHLRGNTLPAGRLLTIHKSLAGATAEPERTRRGSSVASAGPGSTRSKRTGVKAEGRGLSARDDGEPATSNVRQAKAKRAAVDSGAPKPVGRKSGAQSGRATASKAEHKAVVHRVRKGETLDSIASTYKVPVAELRKNNRRAASSLRAGDVLVIPRASQ
jgi:membrane-bound lytic murein transglycosylase D